MTVHKVADDKRIVDQLTFTSKTTKRVTWEAWEFTVVGPHQVEVTNASYGFQKEDHAYVVGVEERSGVLVPAECECPADRHHDPDCKHKVALATVGGPTVLHAAVNVKSATATSSRSTPERRPTVTDRLQTDGGTTTTGSEPEVCLNDDPRCCGPDGDDLPCFACYGDREEGET
jgi:hypothetical protein